MSQNNHIFFPLIIKVVLHGHFYSPKTTVQSEDSCIYRDGALSANEQGMAGHSKASQDRRHTAEGPGEQIVHLEP